MTVKTQAQVSERALEAVLYLADEVPQSADRKGRFEEALVRRQCGASLTELGLLPEDLFWAADHAGLLTNGEFFRTHMERAARQLRQALTEG